MMVGLHAWPHPIVTPGIRAELDTSMDPDLDNRNTQRERRALARACSRSGSGGDLELSAR
jgi:hypothetical protein